MTEIEDKSLLICTLKKSADVLKKVVMYGSYVIVAIAIISAIAYLVWLGFNSPLIIVIYSSIISLLISIPWWAYSIVMAIVAIVGYSFLWCANRFQLCRYWCLREFVFVDSIYSYHLFKSTTDRCSYR
jgi:hypothetical protein